LVPARTLFQENKELRERIAALEKLVGTPPKAATEGQPPTSLFLVTHQQWLINGTIQLADDLYKCIPQPECIRTAIRHVIHRQLEEADGSTDMQQIRACWAWKRECLTYASSCYSMYAAAAGLPQLCTVEMNSSSYCLLGYTDTTSSLSSTESTTSTIPASLSIPELLRANPIAEELTRFAIDELAFIHYLAKAQRALSSQLREECLIADLKYEELSETMKDKLSVKYFIRDKIRYSTAVPTRPETYIVYKRATPPPAEDPA
jgi:hypothetical protein